MVINILLVIVAYLLGSIPSSVWIGKKFYGIDVREHGSKNAGATNTLRVLGRRAALPVFAIDMAKGFAAVMLFHLSPYSHSEHVFFLKIVLIAAVVIGHILPIFAGFRGGKGVATLSGAILAINPPAVLLCLATFVVILAITHYVSVSSMTSGILLPIFTVFVFHNNYLPLLLFECCLSVLLIYTHRKNIRRLIAGTESKIYFRKRPECNCPQDPNTEL